MPADRIIVVDDDHALVTVMGAHLIRQGLRVETFGDGQTALQAVTQGGSVAVLVTDLDMPGLNGLDLMRAARQRDPFLEVIIVTGHGTLEKAVQAMRADGAYDFLTKPFETLKVLSLAVARAMAHRQLRLEAAALTERLSTVLAHTGDAILAAEGDDRLTVVNDAAARMFKDGAQVGAPAAEHLPQSLIALLDNWRRLGQRQPLSMEVSGPEQAVWLVSLTPAPSEGWVMVVRDITALKRLDDLKFQALSEAANKLRLPLAKAIGNMTELNQLVGGNKRAAELIYQQTAVWDRIQRWTEEVQMLVRVEAGVGLRLVEIDLEVALPLLLRGLSEKFKQERRQGVSLRLAPPLPMVRCDTELLRLLLHALAGYAGGRMGAEGLVDVQAYARAGQVWLEVSDSGPAVREADLPHLFDRTRVAQEGGGAELALVKSIVDRLGGQVWLRNRAMVGSTISISLPALGPVPAAWPAGAPVAEVGAPR